MFNLNRDAMKDLTKTRLLSVLTALGLLYVGIDRVFFDKIVGGDPLSWIQRILTILIGMLLSTVAISLFVVAWRGRFPVTAKNTNSIYEEATGRCSSAKPHHRCAKRSGQQLTECDAIALQPGAVRASAQGYQACSAMFETAAQFYCFARRVAELSRIVGNPDSGPSGAVRIVGFRPFCFLFA